MIDKKQEQFNQQANLIACTFGGFIWGIVLVLMAEAIIGA